MEAESDEEASFSSGDLQQSDGNDGGDADIQSAEAAAPAAAVEVCAWP